MAEIGIPTPGVQHPKIVPTQKLPLQTGLAGLGLLIAGSHLPFKDRVCISMERNQHCSPGKKGQNWDSTFKILYIQRFHPEQPCQDRKLCLALASDDYSSSAPETLGLCGFLPVETIVTLWGLLKWRGHCDTEGPCGTKGNIVTLQGLVEPRGHGTELASLGSQGPPDRSS